MWETINNTLNGGNSFQILIFVLVITVLLVVLIKTDYIKIRTAHVKIGVDEKERAILRQQNEWTYQFISGLYGIITEKYPHLDKMKTRYILELMYDEILVWIMFNHITKSEMYVMVKQEKLKNIVMSMDVDKAILSEEFQKQIDKWTKEIINRLVDIREYYSK